ncbi:hypothetical protein ACSBR2_006456 [Camellia fascicularis]
MEEIGTSSLPIPPSSASPPHLDKDDPKDVMNSIHPPRPDWYEELFAFVMAKGSKAYEARVGEVLPLSDASVDAVVGTLVLCSVKDINMTLKEVMRVLKPGGLFLFVEHVAAEDGTILRFAQGIFNPLQQIVSDRCHLTRKTGKCISEAGFSAVHINTTFVSIACILGPHVYGIAFK